MGRQLNPNGKTQDVKWRTIKGTSYNRKDCVSKPANKEHISMNDLRRNWGTQMASSYIKLKLQ